MTASHSPALATRRATGRAAIIRSLFIDIACPLLVYYGLRLGGVEQRWALLASAVVPAAAIVYRLVYRRQVDYTALFILTLIALGVILAALSGDPRTMLVRDAWSGMLGGLIGIWMLGSVITGRRPALMVLFRGFLIAKAGVDGAAAWEARWDTEADFRFGVRLLTVAWGVATLLNAVVSLAFAYLLPIDVAPLALSLTWPVILAPLLVFHIVYTKRKNLRA